MQRNGKAPARQTAPVAAPAGRRGRPRHGFLPPRSMSTRRRIRAAREATLVVHTSATTAAGRFSNTPGTEKGGAPCW